ncbi:hypothetical protein CRU96_14570, partial [Malaciobacter halophilus]
SNQLTLKEKKVYNIFLRQLLDQNIEEYQKNKISTTVTDLCRELGIKNRSEIRPLLERLSDTKIKFDHIDKDGKKWEWNSKLISDYGIEKQRNDSVTIIFSQVLSNEILKYNDRYTKLDLVQLNQLTVAHSITLYEMFRRTICNHQEQYKNFTEKELRERLGLQDKYINIKQFNQKVINKSIDDINIHTYLKVELLKMERPNTKENPTDNRVYKFKIKQSEIPISFSKFRDNLQRLDSSKLFYKKGKRTYTLEEQNLNDYDRKGERTRGKKYWLNEDGETIESSKAKKIYESLYSEFCKDTINFIENKLQIEIEDFIV